MAFARQLFPAVGAGPSRSAGRVRLLVIAAVLAAVCGISAFLFFVARDRSHINVMVADQVENGAARNGNKSIPVVSPPALSNQRQGASASTAAATASGTKPPSQTENTSTVPAGAVPFSLQRSSQSQALGPVKLRLVRTDLSGSSYDVNVTVGARSHSHRKVKLNEPLWIIVNRGAASVKVVVDSIEQNRVSGYWNESGRPARISARKHQKP